MSSWSRPSRKVKRAAPRRCIGKSVTYKEVLHDDGTVELVKRVHSITRLVSPLKVWARQQASGNGPNAIACRRWLANKRRKPQEEVAA